MFPRVENGFLAFLNGCQTVPLRRITPVSVFGRLTQKRGHLRKIRCVATSYKAPTEFAAKFAERFWAAFLPPPGGGPGRTLAGALHAAKQEVLGSEFNNPLGVLYTLFGDGDLRYQACPNAPAIPA